MEQCDDLNLIRRFCESDPIRYRHLVHHVSSPSRQLDVAMREYYGLLRWVRSWGDLWRKPMRR